MSQDVQVKNEGGRVVSSVQLKGANETGYLAAKVIFLGEPLEALKVDFSTTNLEANIIGSAITNTEGLAILVDQKTAPQQVEVGIYWCKIERQPWVQITTVGETSDPFVIVLPVGRPYYRVLGGP